MTHPGFEPILVRVVLEADPVLSIPEFGEQLEDLLALISAFHDLTLSEMFDAETVKRRSASPSKSMTFKAFDALDTRLYSDLRIVRLTYGSPIDVVFWVAGPGAVAVAAWLAVTRTWSQTRLSLERDRADIAKEQLRRRAYQLLGESLSLDVQEAVDIDHIAEVLARVERVEQLSLERGSGQPPPD